jgi:trehalose utilization protein
VGQQRAIPHGNVVAGRQGKSFYFRPEHETFPGYFNPNVLKIIGNAAICLGGQNL